MPAGAPGWRRTLGGRRAELLALVGVLLLALLVRLAFTFRAPPFVTNDSLSYLLPGFDLIHGGGFNPILKRPPLYSLFVGGVLALFGEDLRAADAGPAPARRGDRPAHLRDRPPRCSGRPAGCSRRC